MRVAFFDTRRYDREAFDAANAVFGFDIAFLEPRLTEQTAALAHGFDVVCSFVSDRVDAATLRLLKDGGVKLIALRCAGYNHVDLQTATSLRLPVVRVPEYSPFAVAEHAVALVLALNRKIHRAYARVREGNFTLDGLVGFDLHGKSVGVIGTGRIGAAAARIFAGFGCHVLAFDAHPKPELQQLGVSYVPLAELYEHADIVTLHVPLTPDTHHLINGAALARMKPGVMLINTSRGALIDSQALVAALKSGHVGSAGLDVYEVEEGIFFADLSDRVLQDDVLARLLTFPNVFITAHQGFLTRDALTNIAATTLSNIQSFQRGEPLRNQVRPEDVIHR